MNDLIMAVAQEIDKIYLVIAAYSIFCIALYALCVGGTVREPKYPALHLELERKDRAFRRREARR